jgi:hypothetical protein
MSPGGPALASRRGNTPAPARQRGHIWPALLVFVLLAAGYAWWYFAPDTLPDAVRRQLPLSARANPPLYKWKDDKGRWQVTDAPPTDRPYEKLKYDPRANVVPNVIPPPPPGTAH